MWIWFVIAGLFSGIIAGMGMGGGTLLIPVMTLLLGVTQKLAQSINLLVFIPTAIVALIIHFKNRLVNIKVGLIIISSGLVFSLLGAWLATGLSNNDLRLYFGIFLLFVGFSQLCDSVSQICSKSKLESNVYVKSGVNIYTVSKRKRN